MHAKIDRSTANADAMSSRRQFLKRAGLTGVAGMAMSMTGIGVLEKFADAQGIVEPAYQIDYPDNVTVFVSRGRRFNVVVKDLAGKVLERHRRIRARQLLRIKSDHFTAYEITPPMAQY